MITTPVIQKEIEPIRTKLFNHEVYGAINTLDELNLFLEHHVFTVWDFMSLLKTLQRELTCVAIPVEVPKGNPYTGESHKIAAAFTFTKEDLIPEIFSALVTDLNTKLPKQSDSLRYSLDQHIELDADLRAMAMKMIEELCNDKDKWNDCHVISKMTLQKRLAFWNSILMTIKDDHKHLLN